MRRARTCRGQLGAMHPNYNAEETGLGMQYGGLRDMKQLEGEKIIRWAA